MERYIYKFTVGVIPDGYLTTAEACEKYGLTRCMLLHYTKGHGIAGVVVCGKMMAYKDEDLARVCPPRKLDVTPRGWITLKDAALQFQRSYHCLLRLIKKHPMPTAIVKSSIGLRGSTIVPISELKKHIQGPRSATATRHNKTTRPRGKSA